MQPIGSVSLYGRFGALLLASGFGFLRCEQLPAQNLVPNSSFEEYTGDCVNAPWLWDLVNDWTRPECGYPWEYLNACANGTVDNHFYGVPTNAFGYEHAHSGEAYTVFTPYFPEEYEGDNPQAYLNVDLTEPLVAGQQYCISMWISLAEWSGVKTSSLHAFLWYGLPSICAHNDTLWDDYAAVTFDISAVDTSGWTLVEGYFTAQGEESNLTIGSFLFGSEIDTTHVPWAAPSDLAIYYLDDVQLESCAIGLEEGPKYEPVWIYPNPASDVLYIRLPEGGRAQLEIIDAQAKCAVRTVLASSSHLNLSALETGAYLIRVTTNQEQIIVPLIVQH